MRIFAYMAEVMEAIREKGEKPQRREKLYRLELIASCEEDFERLEGIMRQMRALAAAEGKTVVDLDLDPSNAIARAAASQNN